MKAIGNGWDTNVVSVLLGYLPLPDGEQFIDWCMQIEAGALVKVWNDNERIPAQVDGIVKHVSQPKNETRVDFPVAVEHPNGAYIIHDLDDGNVQYRSGSPGEEEATPDEPAECQLNHVLIGVSLGKR